jgi:hypothetical protein
MIPDLSLKLANQELLTQSTKCRIAVGTRPPQLLNDGDENRGPIFSRLLLYSPSNFQGPRFSSIS